jgi:ribosome maturation factor RimP
VERTLRTPAHFVKAIGETVTVKTRPQVPGDRRLRGALVAADEGGLTVAVDGGPEGGVRLSYSDIDKARTVFVWGPERGSGGSKATPSSKRKSTTPRSTQKTTEQKRKQVVTP